MNEPSQNNLANDHEVNAPVHSVELADTFRADLELGLNITQGFPNIGSHHTSAFRDDSSGIGFLSLPPELRLKIYRYLFVMDSHLRIPEPIQIKRDRISSQPQSPQAAQRDPIVVKADSQFLRCCKTVYIEGLPVLYGENNFTTYYVGSFLEFTKTLSKSSLLTIRYLDLPRRFRETLHARQFRRLVNLRSLILERRMFLGPSNVNPIGPPESYTTVDPMVRIGQSPQELLNDFIHDMARRLPAAAIYLKVEIKILSATFLPDGTRTTHTVKALYSVTHQGVGAGLNVALISQELGVVATQSY
jgi:hypothetical protein